ncbi:MAG: hypothetical protein Q8P20_01180 [bacterium]|nr:hypothetical protein [bacterium]
MKCCPEVTIRIVVNCQKPIAQNRYCMLAILGNICVDSSCQQYRSAGEIEKQALLKSAKKGRL